MSMTVIAALAGSMLVAAPTAPGSAAAPTMGSVTIQQPVAVTIITNPYLRVFLSGGVPPMFTFVGGRHFGIVTKVSKDEAAGLSVSVIQQTYGANTPRVFVIVAQFN